MARDRRSDDAGRAVIGSDERDRRWQRTEEPTWRRALNGIGSVVVMAIVVVLVGLALSWLATLVL
ncbi:MAG TPA: hypothetical protein VJ978_12290 [Nitriliruptoraceae bacterium]|nr:hypothetical protein [Nitriliruptoraceae bacterium]